MKRNQREFLNEIQKHEREWGNETYTGRPNLDQILAAKVVAFWHPSGIDPDMHMTITLHDDLNDIDRYVKELVLHTTKARLPIVRLSRVFVNKREVEIQGVQVIFKYKPE